ERHVVVDGEAMSGSLFDFGLYVFHCAKAQMAQGATPAFYLPKLESHFEARLWNDVFSDAERELGVPHGTFKATILIETLPAAFEMDEILYELRDHIVGLNCGRWARHSSTPIRSSSSKPVTAAAPSPWAAWRRRFRSRATRPQTKPPSRRC